MEETLCATCFGDSVSHDGTEDSIATHKAAVQGGESTVREGESARAVVRKERVGVLQEGDHDEPVGCTGTE